MIRKWFIYLAIIVPIMACSIESCITGQDEDEMSFVLSAATLNIFPVTPLTLGVNEVYSDFSGNMLQYARTTQSRETVETSVFQFVMTLEEGSYQISPAGATITEQLPTSLIMVGTTAQLQQAIETLSFRTPADWDGQDLYISWSTINVTSTVAYKELSLTLNSTLILRRQVAAASAPPAVDCEPFRATSPLEGLPNGEADFYWDAAPGATRYTVNFYKLDTGSPVFVTSWSVDAPTTTLRGNIGTGAIGDGASFGWEVVAFLGDSPACLTPFVSMFRDTVIPEPPPVEPEPEPQKTVEPEETPGF
jgi:hypothetical protein